MDSLVEEQGDPQLLDTGSGKMAEWAMAVETNRDSEVRFGEGWSMAIPVSLPTNVSKNFLRKYFSEFLVRVNARRLNRGVSSRRREGAPLLQVPLLPL
jgi:hypothetical protein